MKEKHKDTWHLVMIATGMAVFLGLMQYLMSIMTTGDISPSAEIMQSFGLSLPFMLLSTLASYRIAKAFNSSAWFSRHLPARIAAEGAAAISVGITLVTIGNLPFVWIRHTDIMRCIGSVSFFVSCLASVLLSIFTITLIELYLQNRKKQHIMQENSRMQYQLLKSQLNPHFLFNSLNSLISLIHDDSEKAAGYTARLAQVYRYVLKNEKRNTVTLAEELEFVNNYTGILQIRFGSKLQTTVDIKPEDMNREIPPMSLQGLVENAVKHNALPVHISIVSNGNVICVSNGMSPKQTPTEGTGTGLENLKRKYMIIAQKDIEITEDENTFTVKLPLI